MKSTRRAQVVGVDVETKVVKTENADVKPYVDYSRLLGISNPVGVGARADGGGGFTAGVLGRFNAGEVKVHAFRLVAEARLFDGNYLPGYFDTFYEVQKYQFITGAANTAYDPKLPTVLNRDPSHKRAGFYVEGAYQYNGGLAMMAAYEDSFHVAGPDSICFGCTGLSQYVGSRNLTLHIEYPAYSWLQFFASYYRRSFDGAGHRRKAARRQHAGLRRRAVARALDLLPQRPRLPELAGGPGAGRDEEPVGRRRRLRDRATSSTARSVRNSPVAALRALA